MNAISALNPGVLLQNELKFIHNSHLRVESKRVKPSFTRLTVSNSPSFSLRGATSFSRFKRGPNSFRIQDSVSSGRLQKCYSSVAANGTWEVPAEENNSDPPEEKISLGRKLRAFFFYLWTAILSIPLFLSMLVMHPFILAFDKYRRNAHHFVNNLWAIATMVPFYKVEIIGKENLPPASTPSVYVANHQSFLDIFTLFALQRPFKFISKTENFLIPIIGWSMFLTGHVPLKRMDSRSQRECLMKCLNLLKEGASVLFFPEGTRTVDGKMAPFKKGAFSVAAKAQAQVVPISLIGTGYLMPNKQEGSLRPGKVTVVIHPPLTGKSADVLCENARAVIAQTLTEYGLGVHPQH